MTTPSSPSELVSADFITAATGRACGAPLQMEARLIPFKLYEEDLSRFNIDLGGNKFAPNTIGTVLKTAPIKAETIEASEVLQPPGILSDEAFEFAAISYGSDAGIPTIQNAHILNAIKLADTSEDGSQAEKRFFTKKDKGQMIHLLMPATLPQSLITTADGRHFLSADSAQNLQTSYEEAKTRRLSKYIENSTSVNDGPA